MKTFIATAAVALSLSAPAFADVSDPKAFFALGNDSAAERIVGETSVGDFDQARRIGAQANESAAERAINPGSSVPVTRDLRQFFALGNDSAAERIVRK